MNNKRTYTIKTWNPLWNPEKPNEQEQFITVFEIEIEQPSGVQYTNIQWDSKTGLVTANINGSKERQVIPHKGKSLGKIPPGPFKTFGVALMEHSYWYN